MKHNDNTRDADLYRLKAVIDSATAPATKKRQAAGAFRRIIAQMNHRELIDLRHRLVRATLANDQKEVEKIGAEISDYQSKHKLDR